jgi:hypothetical protein
VDAGNSWKILWRHAEEMTMNVDIFYFLKFFVATSRSIQRAVLMQSPKHWCDMKGKPMGLSTPQVHHGCYLLVVLLLVLVSIYSLSCVPGCLHMYIYISIP